MLNIKILRYKKSYDFKNNPSLPDGFENNWKNNSQDWLVLCDDKGELFRCHCQSVANYCFGENATADNVSYGDTLSILHENNSCITMESENEVYAKAVYKEVEYWICIDTIALQCETALVLDKASLYADKEFMLSTDEGNSPFRFGDVVCRSLTPEDESNSFDRIYYYDKGTQKVKSAYIKKDLISTRTDDIVVMDCVRQLRITKRATPRNEIFRRAARYNPCPRVAAALEAEKTEKIENNYQDVLNALPGAKYKVNVPELLTVDQSKDPFR